MGYNAVRGILAGLGLVTALASAASAATPSVTWLTNLEKGLAVAKKRNKPVVIAFTQEWCEWCERMDRDTLTDPKVIKLSQQFVMIRPAEDENLRRRQLRYGVRSLPTYVITSPDGREIGRVNGYRPASSFTEELKIALSQVKPVAPANEVKPPVASSTIKTTLAPSTVKTTVPSTQVKTAAPPRPRALPAPSDKSHP